MNESFFPFICMLVTNIIAWLVFLIVFRKKYSPENVLNDISVETTRLISEIVQTSQVFLEECASTRKELTRLLKECNAVLNTMQNAKHSLDLEKQISQNTNLQIPMPKKQVDEIVISEKAKSAKKTNPNLPKIVNTPIEKISDETKILKLYNRGDEAKEIAKKLNLPYAKVEFTINLEKMKKVSLE